MIPYTKLEADWLAGTANDPGHPARLDPNRRDVVPNITPELIEWHLAEARRLRAEFIARAARRLISALSWRADSRSARGQGGVLGRLERHFADLSDGVRRIRTRQRILAALGPRGGRLLEDIGLSPTMLSERAAAIVAEKRSRREENKMWREIERQVRRELMAYSDRELDDLGISRVDIPRIARSHKSSLIDSARVRAMIAAGPARPAANANTAPAGTGDRRA
jgi:uncharacterized protein YjiS (DUF1127 family)